MSASRASVRFLRSVHRCARVVANSARAKTLLTDIETSWAGIHVLESCSAPRTCRPLVALARYEMWPSEKPRRSGAAGRVTHGLAGLFPPLTRYIAAGIATVRAVGRETSRS